MATLITAGVLLAFIAGVIGLLVFVNNRDKRRAARNNPQQ
jgi:hypothetical protein